MPCSRGIDLNKLLKLIRGTPAPAVFCGLMRNPREDGSTTFCGSTATKFKRVLPRRNSFSVVEPKVWFHASVSSLICDLDWSPKPGIVAPVKGSVRCWGAR